jgi:hypothetical protein
VSGNTRAVLLTRTAAGRDAYGEVTYTETFTMVPAIYWPAGTFENHQAQDQITWRDTLCLPDGTDVTAIDAVIPQPLLDGTGDPVLDGDGHPQGDRFEIEGNPTPWPANPMSTWRPDFPVVLELQRQV